MFEQLKEKVKAHKVQVMTGIATTAVVCTPVAAFAAEGDLPSVTIDAALVSPIVTSISSAVTTLLPIGIAIMGIMIGVSLIPRIIYKFF